MATYQVPFPGWKLIVPQVALFFVFEDMFHYFGKSAASQVYSYSANALFFILFYLAHQALHTGVLYKHIHKIHHKYSAPFGLAAEYCHPAEVAILGMGTIGGPLLYCYFMRDLHIITVHIWITLRLFQAIDAHSGYGTIF